MKATLIKFNILSNKLTQQTVNWNDGYMFKADSDFYFNSVWYDHFNSAEENGNYFLIFTTTEKKKIRDAKIKLLRYASKTIHEKLLCFCGIVYNLNVNREKLYDLLPPHLK